MTDSPQIAAARLEAERTRARLMGTAQQLQDRLSPRTLARNTWQGAKEKGADLTENAVDAVRARPVAAGGVAAAIAVFLVRHPLMDLAGRMFGGSKKKTRKQRKSNNQDQSEKTE